MVEINLPQSPYKGLMPFLEADAAFFFGRDSERKIISANLRTRRLTVLYGRSGVGKTSVINAGVVHHLRSVMQRQQPSDDSSLILKELVTKPTVVVAFDNWIGDPLHSLQDAILAEFEESGLVFKFKTRQELRAVTLTEMLAKLTTNEQSPELLVILDQFEDYFVYHPYDEGPGAFEDEFSRAVTRPDVHANFLISIREDWLSRLDRFKGRIPNLFENSIRIDHLKRKAAHDAIERPIEKYNEVISLQKKGSGEKAAKIVIERGFTTKALDQLVKLDEPGEVSLNSPELEISERPIRTSRLQLVLHFLWNKIKDDTPPTLGLHLLSEPDTIRHIFQLHLEESLAPLTKKERSIAANLLRFMITPSGKKFASTAKELASQCNHSPQEIALLLKKLSTDEVGVLNVVAPPPGHHYRETHYEIASDVLADAILDWVKIMREHQRRRKKINKRTLYAFIFGMALLLVLIGFALFNALRQRRRLEAAQQEIQTEKDKYKGVLDVARQLNKRVLLGHSQKVTSAVFTQDGRILTASKDGSAILWDINPVREVQDFTKNEKDEKPLILAAINPQGSLVVTASSDGLVRLWKVGVRENPILLRERVGKHVTALSFSPLGDVIAASNTAGTLMIWNTATRALVKEIPGNGQAMRQIAFSPSGNLLAAASEDHTIRIWRGNDWLNPTVLVGHNGTVNGIAFSPNEESIASVSADANLRIWDLRTSHSRVFSGHVASINSVDFDSEGKRLLTASDDNTARVWDVETGKSIQLIGHTDKVLTASFSPGGLNAVTAGKDKLVRIWSVGTGKPLLTLEGHTEQVTYVSYSEDGQYILTASDDATARVWSAPESGSFKIEQPTIEARPYYHPGDCPVTINFLARITAVSGSGTVVYRFKGSDGRVGLPTELKFEESGSRFVGWYWKVSNDYTGSATIEILEPKEIKEQRAKFTIKCKNVESVLPSPSPTPAPTLPSP